MSQTLCESVSQALSACAIRSPSAPFDAMVNGIPLIALATGTAAAMAPERAHIINSTGLVLMSAVLTVSIVGAMIATAYRGKILADSWHQVWTPITLSLSVGAVAPVAGGKSLAQTAVETVIGLFA